MPAPKPRDPAATRRVLTEWLGGRVPGARITHFETPQSSGFSSESLLLDVEHEGVTDQLVCRIAPVSYQVFPDPKFLEQFRLMRILDAETDIPVPSIRWYEPDDAFLGAPFFVMQRVAGRVPTDVPPYHQGGWVTEVSPRERADMWWSTLEILARLHRLDPHALHLDFLDEPRFGTVGLDQRLGFYEYYLNWAYAGPKQGTLRALAWLKANRPAEPHPPALLWGDARIGNVIYVDGVPQAVLDWETAALGQPEEDLAWYLFLDRHHSEGIEVPRLAGFPTAAATIERYQELLGRPLVDMRYYEILSAFKFTVIMSRIGQAMIDFDWMGEEADFPYNNPCSRLLDRLLDEVGAE